MTSKDDTLEPEMSEAEIQAAREARGITATRRREWEAFGGRMFGIFNVEGEGDPSAIFLNVSTAERELARRRDLDPDHDDGMTEYHQVFVCHVTGYWWNSYDELPAEDPFACDTSIVAAAKHTAYQRGIEVGHARGLAEGRGAIVAQLRRMGEISKGRMRVITGELIKMIEVDGAADPAGVERGRREAIEEAVRYLRVDSNHAGRVGCSYEIERHEAELAQARKAEREKAGQ